MQKLIPLWNTITGHLDKIGEYASPLVLRLLLGWEYFESGLVKFRGENWFQHVQDNFPFPFNVVPVELSWFMATWFEILGGLALFLGLFTRFFSASLIILTIVAILAVHWPAEWNSFSDLLKGYAISDKGFGNYKLPLIFIVMFIPLLFSGPGKASVDYFLRKKFIGN
ncbi:MAG: DoxX family protein [Gammaproteobacteria bacterium]|nr:DoxX family protein [Gammaproteobacteria bacterium]